MTLPQRFALVVCALGAQVVIAQTEARTPLEAYRGDTGIALYICSKTFQVSQLHAQLGRPEDDKNDYVKCINTSADDAKKGLAKALKTVKKPKAQEALKTYHVAFVSALRGIYPADEERRISYEQRQAALNDKVEEAWARFEVEQ